MKKYLLVDADSKEGFPNLALMKLSAFVKGLNEKNTVALIRGIPDTAPLEDYDHAFISCVYFQNKTRVAEYAAQLLSTMKVDNIEIGGSGWNYTNTLPRMIEHIKPDYSLYDVDFSMGFTSRGCIRKCGFCIVPRKEGGIRNHAHISEFWDHDHKKIVLLDNNFLASRYWKENLAYIRDHKLKVNFNQGLDIRLVNKSKAAALAEVKMYGWSFKPGARGMHFAFDHPRGKKKVLDGIDLLVNAGIRPRWLMFYVLTGYNTTPTQDYERFKILIDAGVKPFIMVYNKKKDPWLSNFSRWVNRKYYEWVPFEDYKEGVLDIEIKCC